MHRHTFKKHFEYLLSDTDRLGFNGQKRRKMRRNVSRRGAFMTMKRNPRTLPAFPFVTAAN
jgi:hypothetical protein